VDEGVVLGRVAGLLAEEESALEETRVVMGDHDACAGRTGVAARTAVDVNRELGCRAQVPFSM